MSRRGGCRNRALTEFGFHFEPLLKRKDELASFRDLVLGSMAGVRPSPQQLQQSSQFGMVLLPVAPG